DDVYQAFLREGGSGTGFFIRDRTSARKLLQEMQRDGRSARDLLPTQAIRDVWETIQFLNRTVEEAPRVAKFADELRRGRTPAEAAVGGREVSLDFSRGGSATQEIRKLRAFWNPTIQGMDKLRSVLNPRRNP